MQTLSRVSFIFVAALFAVSRLGAQSCTTNSNTTTCTAANGTISVGGSPAESTPYPLSLAVSGVPSGAIQKITVSVNNLAATSGFSGGDFMIVLVSPTNEQLELLSQYCDDDADITNISLTFDDTVGTYVNNGSTACGHVANGTFHTTAANDLGTGLDTVPGLTLTSAHVAQTYGTGTLSNTFTGNPNGTWKLYVAMPSPGYDTGTLGSAGTAPWSISITMNTSSTATTMTISRSTGSTPALSTDTLGFKATVAPIPTGGTLTFQDNGSNLAGCTSMPVDGSGQATCSTKLAQGAHNITASYSGGTGFGPSTSTSIFQVTNNATTLNGNSYCNPGAITLPGTGDAAQPVPASPYASEVFISNVTGIIEKATVTLNNITSPALNQQGFMLVGPNGKTLDFLSYAGGSSGISGTTVTIDDAGANGLMAQDSSPASGGTYQPTSNISLGTSYCTLSAVSNNTCNGVLVSEAPPNTFVSATNLGTGTFGQEFGGISPNGT